MISVNIYPCDGLLPNITKPLSKPILTYHQFDGLAQDGSNCSALAVELLLFCAKPSSWSLRNITQSIFHIYAPNTDYKTAPENHIFIMCNQCIGFVSYNVAVNNEHIMVRYIEQRSLIPRKLFLNNSKSKKQPGAANRQAFVLGMVWFEEWLLIVSSFIHQWLHSVCGRCGKPSDNTNTHLMPVTTYEGYSVSNHKQLDSLFDSMLRLITTKISNVSIML